MDIKQAIESINIGMINYTTHGGWRFSSINWVALDVALSALRAQAERENPKPLTEKELRETTSPVWIKRMGDDDLCDDGWTSDRLPKEGE